MNFFSGYKTYILGLAAIIYAITGWFIGNLDQATAMQAFWAGLTAMTLRSGITAETKK